MDTTTIIFLSVVFVAIVFAMFMAIKYGTNSTETGPQQPQQEPKRIPDTLMELDKTTVAERQRMYHHGMTQQLLLDIVQAQAQIAGDTDTLEKIRTDTYDGPMPIQKPDGTYTNYANPLYDFSISGINYRKASEVKRCRGWFWCKLIPEPTNEFDPNAIKIVHEGNIHVGYIPADSTDFVRSIVKLPAFAFGEIVESEDYSDEQPRAFFYGKVYLELKQKQPTSNGQLSKITV